jgi:hypothetical protein
VVRASRCELSRPNGRPSPSGRSTTSTMFWRAGGWTRVPSLRHGLYFANGFTSHGFHCEYIEPVRGCAPRRCTFFSCGSQACPFLCSAILRWNLSIFRNPHHPIVHPLTSSAIRSLAYSFIFPTDLITRGVHLAQISGSLWYVSFSSFLRISFASFWSLFSITFKVQSRSLFSSHSRPHPSINIPGQAFLGWSPSVRHVYDLTGALDSHDSEKEEARWISDSVLSRQFLFCSEK